MSGYRCILADPPWYERGGGKYKRGADRHYPIMKTPQIVDTIYRSPLFQPHAEGCHLWLWVTNNFLEDGLFVMKALGFRYVTNAVWAKTSIGLGQYLRGQHEIMLFGIRGRLPSESRSWSSLVGGGLVKRTEHSRKPEESYAIIEGVSPGPRAEIFARRERPGWDVWGNQVEGRDES